MKFVLKLRGLDVIIDGECPTRSDEDKSYRMVVNPEYVDTFFKDLRYLIGTGSGKAFMNGMIGNSFSFYNPFSSAPYRYEGIEECLCFISEEEFNRLKELIGVITKEEYFKECQRFMLVKYGIIITDEQLGELDLDYGGQLIVQCFFGVTQMNVQFYKKVTGIERYEDIKDLDDKDVMRTLAVENGYDVVG
jgi:hypothetical protein